MAAKQNVEAKAREAARLDAGEFHSRLIEWYRDAARKLPWRETKDPYNIWVSEIMLQQTRVAAVIEHYNEFLRRFPTLVALALADEADVLAAWSGLGYYRRARMLHKAARFIVLERDGRLPATAAELRTLPGIGDYTATAIASIAFGEPVAVVDGNVERVILRLAGRAEEATAAATAFVREQAQALMPVFVTPPNGVQDSEQKAEAMNAREAHSHRTWAWQSQERIALAASVRPTERAGGDDMNPRAVDNVAGDHNQAMMELGAMICLPRNPVCDECPVFTMCRTRGEHATRPRGPQRSRQAAHLLDLRKRGTTTEVLLELRGTELSVMPAMFELPALPMDTVEEREPILRVRHSITNTNYYVQVFAPEPLEGIPKTSREQSSAHPLRKAVRGAGRELLWVRTSRLPGLPMTGLTRKILQRLRVMDSPRMALLE